MDNSTKILVQINEKREITVNDLLPIIIFGICTLLSIAIGKAYCIINREPVLLEIECEAVEDDSPPSYQRTALPSFSIQRNSPPEYEEQPPPYSAVNEAFEPCPPPYVY